jgi:hypothetical protein
MVERENFLNGDLALAWFVKGSSYRSICAFANCMQKLVVIALIEEISSLERRQERRTHRSRTWAGALDSCEPT